MAEGPGPISSGLAALGKVAFYPFKFPMDMTVQGRAIGAAGANLGGGIAAAVAGSLASLDPKGPLLWAAKGAAQVAEATQWSEERANKVTQQYWLPVSDAIQTVGAGTVGLLAWPYLKAAGAEVTRDNIVGLLGGTVLKPPSGGDGGGDGGGGEAASADPNKGDGAQGGSPSPQGGPEASAPTDGPPPDAQKQAALAAAKDAAAKVASEGGDEDAQLAAAKQAAADVMSAAGPAEAQPEG